jgi:AAA domain-containing protein
VKKKAAQERLPQHRDPIRDSGAWPANFPGPVRQAYERGLWVIPRVLNRTAGRWHPPFKWKRYLAQRPSKADLTRWHGKFPGALWAIITGHGVIVLEFDDAKTFERSGLRGHFISPTGSRHVYIEAPGYLVQGGSRVDPENFPGMDLLAYGQTATFYGNRPPDGRYGADPDRPDGAYTVEALPNKALRRLIEGRKFKKRELRAPELPEGFSEFVSVPELLGDALRRSASKGRNDTGLWLACQLRDEQHSHEAVEAIVVGQYQPLVAENGSHPYTPQEAYDSVVSAFSRPARPPRLLQDGGAVELFSNVTTEKLTWLWELRIPMRKVSLMEGDPDLGKSTITADLAARQSRGTPMPGDAKGTGIGSVLIICAEDDIADTVKPRLAAAGANMKRIGFIPLEKDQSGQVMPLSIPEDLARIRRAIRDLASKTGRPVKLVIIDPITAYLSEKINYNNDPQVRRAMLPLKQVAEETGVAVLLVRHLNKDGSLRALYRGGGSIAFSASARSVLVAERHPDEKDVYVLARVKMNLGPAIRPITYRIEGDLQHDVSRIAWGDLIDISVEALLRSDDSRKDAPARREAEQFLRELLGEGPRDSKEVERAAQTAGLSMRTVKNAKRNLRIKSHKLPGKAGQVERWQWELPFYVKDSVVHFDLD